jgi:hypothetical protein
MSTSSGPAARHFHGSVAGEPASADSQKRLSQLRAPCTLPRSGFVHGVCCYHAEHSLETAAIPPLEPEPVSLVSPKILTQNVL